MREPLLCLGAAVAFSVWVYAAGDRSSRQAARPGDGTSAISGTVVDGATNAPVRDAVVELRIGGRPAAREGSRQLTDGRGRFVFVGLPASSSVSLRASRPGYLESSLGGEIGPRRILLKDDEWLDDLRLELWRPGVIAGRVTDERGDPVVGGYVRALQRIELFGRAQVIVGDPTVTDDEGRYRIADLTAGEYVVQVPAIETSTAADAAVRDLAVASARPAFHGNLPVPPPTIDGQPMGYLAGFAPQQPLDGLSSTLTLGRGETREGVDVQLVALPAFAVSGHVTGPQESWGGVELRLVGQGLEWLGAGGVTAVARVADDGRFAFSAVPAGTYILGTSPTSGHLTRASTAFQPSFSSFAFSYLSGGSPPDVRSRELAVGPQGLMMSTAIASGIQRRFWARQLLAVGGAMGDVTVIMHPAAVMRGRVTEDLDGRFPRPGVPPAVGITLDAVDGSPVSGEPTSSIEAPRNSDGAFSIAGIMPGIYMPRASNGWLIRSVSWNGRDYLDQPFDASASEVFDGVEIVVTNAGSTIAGSARDDRGRVAAGAVAVVFPSDPEAWARTGMRSPRVRTTALTDSGEYEIAGLPAGDHAVVLVASPREAAEVGPAAFRTWLPAAARVTLGWGDRRSVNLVLRGEGQP